jgi:hypothetical protein
VTGLSSRFAPCVVLTLGVAAFGSPQAIAGGWLTSVGAILFALGFQLDDSVF